MTDWTPKRAPDEVPTPIAVAVSDYCRRAKSPASAAEVREALSFLSEDEDFRVRSVTGAEPDHSPLGPLAVVDMAQGTAAELASRRQACGYYELVRQLATRAPAQLPTPAPTEVPRSPPSRSSRSPPKGVEEPKSLAQRIAPKKRVTAPEVPFQPRLEEEEPSSKRQLPAPRGRFTRLASAKHPASELLEPSAGELLLRLIEQHGNRAALVRSLSEQYSGRAGSPFSAADLEAALERHGLEPKLAARERELIISAYREHRGASGRVAWALGMSPVELERLVKKSALSREVDELRERFRREALSPDLRYRLDLLGRNRYLADLGIKDRFTQRLSADLTALLEGCLEGATDVPSLVQAAAKKHGLAPELLSRAVEKLSLAAPLAGRLPLRAADSVP